MTAVICGTELQALGAIRAAHNLGLPLPEDLSIISGDGTALVEVTEPPLTSVQ
jgi:LacI family transcriptional regulator, repressor for deo operon, udp, cdd, tsx, nupC, and nupG